MEQMQLSFYPKYPGYKAEGQSREAAERIDTKAQSLKRRILGFMKLNCQGYTADEIAGYFKESVLSIRPRFSELLAENLIFDTGQRRFNASGVKASVWRAA